MKNKNINSTVITPLIRVSTAMIAHEGTHFEDYYQFETIIFYDKSLNKDFRVINHEIVLCSRVNIDSRIDQLTARSNKIHNHISDNLKVKYAEDHSKYLRSLEVIKMADWWVDKLFNMPKIENSDPNIGNALALIRGLAKAKDLDSISNLQKAKFSEEFIKMINNIPEGRIINITSKSTPDHQLEMLLDRCNLPHTLCPVDSGTFMKGDKAYAYSQFGGTAEEI